MGRSPEEEACPSPSPSQSLPLTFQACQNLKEKGSGSRWSSSRVTQADWGLGTSVGPCLLPWHPPHLHVTSRGLAFPSNTPGVGWSCLSFQEGKGPPWT